jgi:NADPH:quinone reductase-like Zn-dependent oxidoreductase
MEILDRAKPEPDAGQVRIAVERVAVNPVDLVTRAGILSAAGLHGEPPVRLGWDVAGVVEAVGANVRRLRVGDRVVGLSDRITAASKTYADAVVLDEQNVSSIPSELGFDRAAAVPLAGLTAMQALSRADLAAGQSLLITGVGGAVGGLAAQLALFDGVRVVAAGRPRDEAVAKSLGVEEFVVADDDLAEAVRRVVPGGVDAALDAATIHGPVLDAVRNGGIHISLVVLERPAPLRAVTTASIAVRADWQQLSVLASLAASGALQISIVEQFDLDRVRDAHAAAEQVTGGRVLLTV